MFHIHLIICLPDEFFYHYRYVYNHNMVCLSHMVYIFLPQQSVFILFLTKSYHFLCLNASIKLAVKEDTNV